MAPHAFLVSEIEEVVLRSESPEDQFLYTPSIVIAEDQSQLLSHDIGGDGVSRLEDWQPFPKSNQRMVCRIHRRAMGEKAFEHVVSYPMCHARLFKVRSKIYVIGHNGSVQIAFSEDNGKTWSRLYQLTDTDGWHASACNVWYSNDRLYLCMERREGIEVKGWNVAGLAPHILSVNVSDDLTNEKSWTISHSFTFDQMFGREKFNYFGLPFQQTGFKYPSYSYSGDKLISSSPMGWLEGNVFQINDINHIWHDKNINSFIVALRSNTAGVGYACYLKVVEINVDGKYEMYTEVLRVPSGEAVVFLPFPGGHNKFQIEYDKIGKRFWMCSTQSSDSMLKYESIPEKRHNLASNERNRLAIYHSKNAVDWLFSGIVSIGEQENCARNYPSIAIDGNDMVIALRGGDQRALNSQYTNLIMINKIKDFRRLQY